MPLKAASAKAKGLRLEKKVEARLLAAGLRARRQPGSGIYSAFPHDVALDLPGVGPLIIECKKRKEGHKTLDKWLGKGDLLVIEKDHGEPKVYMDWTLFEQMVRAINAAED